MSIHISMTLPFDSLKGTLHHLIISNHPNYYNHNMYNEKKVNQSTLFMSELRKTQRKNEVFNYKLHSINMSDINNIYVMKNTNHKICRRITS